MKYKTRSTLLVLAVIMLLVTACNSGKKSQDGASPETAKAKTDGVPVIASENIDYNWGEVKEGKIVEHVFKFVNKGDGILEIKKATGS